MTFPTIKPSVNGKVEAPSSASGASFISPKRTVFPVETVRPSWRTVLYALHHRQFAGAPQLRWLLLMLFGATLLWSIGGLPGQWWVAASTGILWLTLFGFAAYWRRRDFVRFDALPLPLVTPLLLDPQEKIAIQATGLFSVENKYRRFTWLPGFYRTFATREHAVLCQLRQPSLGLLGQLPSEEIGLWYMFFMPTTLVGVTYGRLYFGRQGKVALAATSRVTIPKRNRFRPAQIRDEVIYLAFETEAEAATVLADLLYDLPVTEHSAAASNS